MISAIETNQKSTALKRNTVYFGRSTQFQAYNLPGLPTVDLSKFPPLKVVRFTEAKDVNDPKWLLFPGCCSKHEKAGMVIRYPRYPQKQFSDDPNDPLLDTVPYKVTLSEYGLRRKY